MNIRLRIERLVLEGIQLETGGAQVLQASLENELARLVAAGGLKPALLLGGALHSVRPGAIQLSGEGPSQMGKQLAHALYHGLGTPKER
jgi:hypothetical protein